MSIISEAQSFVEQKIALGNDCDATVRDQVAFRWCFFLFLSLRLVQ